HLTFNQGVEGSSPSWLTSMYSTSLCRRAGFFCMLERQTCLSYIPPYGRCLFLLSRVLPSLAIDVFG
ncbi:hypothetical protein, partial [uncultured Paenibacillus sp.]|uniref:hypothetical protein n=1 Tax=uncultured Paenibacillus sp. TaxID=227322 RepID=UPI0025D0EDEC